MTVGERVVTFMTIYLNLFHLPTFPYLHCWYQNYLVVLVGLESIL